MSTKEGEAKLDEVRADAIKAMDFTKNDFHKLSVEEAINKYKTGKTGLSKEKVNLQRKKFGTNELSGETE
jgi:hypothetical protein